MTILWTTLSTEMAKTELQDGSGEGRAYSHPISVTSDKKEESHSEGKSAFVASEHRANISDIHCTVTICGAAEFLASPPSSAPGLFYSASSLLLPHIQCTF